MPRKRVVADLFCGAGGSSTGASNAIAAAGETIDLVAVNHWPVAIESHALNHPGAAHYCIDLDAADPEKLVPGGYLDLLLASPECKDHSTAKGGKPVSEQKRASAWHIPRWADRIHIRQIIVENVPRFQKWGPLDRHGRPIKHREGEMFQAWLNVLRAMGYKVEYRVLNAADYGDPQCRERLFVMARRDGRRIVWPVPTHAKNGAGGLPRWRSAREIIDFSIPSRDAFEPGRDLSENTIARIAEGMRRFSPALYEPFLVVLRKNGGAQSLDAPLPTITAGGTHLALAEPFTIPQGGGGAPRSIEDPLSTIATDGAISVVQPMLEPFTFANRTNATPRGMDEPIATMTTAHGGGISLVEPFIVPQRSMQPPMSADAPLPTITCTSRGIGLAEPYLVTVNHPGERLNPDIDQPLPTLTAKNGLGVAEPFLTADEPNVIVDGVPYRLGVRFRMLQPSELKRGQSFPDDYEFAGTKTEATAMIGNAVPVKLSRALVSAALYGTVPDTLDVVA